VWWLYPPDDPIEIISPWRRVLSLTVRLYANMFAGDLVTLAFFSLVPVGIPLVFLGCTFLCGIQAYVFHAVDDDLSVAGSGARPLKFSFAAVGAPSPRQATTPQA